MRLSETFDGNNFSVRKYFADKYHSIPSEFDFSLKLEVKDEFLTKFDLRSIRISESPTSNYTRSFGTYEAKAGKEIMVTISIGGYSMDVTCYYGVNNNDTTEQVGNIRTFCKSNLYIPEDVNKIGMLVNRGGELRVQQARINKCNMDVELNYGKVFMPYYQRIKEFIETKNSGIVLLHGIPGTGKTTLIRHLITNTKKGNIFVPSKLVDQLDMPSFSDLMINNADSVIIIEDAEKALASREGRESSGVSGILNLTDGILGDVFSPKIICTFNTVKTNIDAALLRKGRLVAEYKFDKLSIDDTNKLFKHLGKDITSHSPMALTDIYNYDEVDLRVTEKERAAIGFRA